MKIKVNVSDLKEKWNLISDAEVKNGYKSLRLPPECTAEIYIAMNNMSKRCLILYLPVSHDVDINLIELDKITIEQYHNPDYLILTLLDNEYLDIFDDFIISLYNSIKDITDVGTYLNIFIQTLHKWTQFFEESQDHKLTKEQVKGMFGELVVLKRLIQNADSFNINDMLESWEGPYDRAHDFVLDDKDIEVKTKYASKLYVQISSEFQLEYIPGKALELLVISVEEDPVNGSSIKELVDDIRNIIANVLGDSSVLLRAIGQKRLTLNNIHEYNNFRFRLINQYTYDCISPDFPKITTSTVPISINNIRYNLYLSGINEFLISSEEF